MSAAEEDWYKNDGVTDSSEVNPICQGGTRREKKVLMERKKGRQNECFF